ncbi:MAG TPA: hypothetical protein VOA87_19395 [Thermoanaerobaculia bacterium]|nr:hypothetical protein [Thermoanaerobaculia bacterium]
MRLSTTHAVCLSVVLLGLSFTVYKVHFPPGPQADEAAYVMMAQSLWHDHDLTYDHRDLFRAYRLWDQGPYGVVLSTTDGGKTMHYGKPFIYSLAALPFYAVFGVQGLVVFNMALFLAMFWSACWFFRAESGYVGLYLAGFFFASVAYNYVFWMQPEVFNMACVFFPLLLWQHLRRRGDDEERPRDLWLLAGAGALLAAAFVSKETMVLLGGPIAVDLAWRRRFGALAAFVAPALLALVLLAGTQQRLTGSWSPYRGVQRRSFESEYPIESRRDLWQLYRGTSFGSWSGLGIQATPRTFARDLEYFVFGRHTGLLPYFPFALFAFGLYLSGPRDRSRHLLLLAVAGYCLSLVLLRPDNYQGGLGFLGNRYFASIYPALLFLPGRMAAKRSLILPFAAAGLWTASLVAVPLQAITPEATLQAHARTATFQALPLELTLLNKIPGYFLRGWGDGVWVVPKQNFFADERNPNGVWVRGACRSEVVLVTVAPVDAVRFRAYSLSDVNELDVDSGVDRVRVVFDSEAKREGTPIELKVEPVAKDLGFFPQAPHEYFYRFTLTDTDGLVPAHRNPQSDDLRYLGVFLSFNGKGP